MSLQFALWAATTFEIPAWGRLTIIDMVWTGLGLVGIAVTGWKSWKIFNDHLIFYTEDYAAIEPPVRRAMRLVWRGHLRREALRFTQMAGVLVFGIWASVQQSIVNPPVITVTGLILTVLLTYIVAINVVQSLKDSHDARRVREVLGV